MSPTPESPDKSEKEFAPPYEEEYEELSREDVTKATLRHNTVDMTYSTRGGKTKTVRCTQATEPYGDTSDLPDGCVTFFDYTTGGDSYTFNIDSLRLISCNTRGQNRTVATADDFQHFRKVIYPDPAPVKGAVEEGVEVTIYYRSPRTDRMQTVTIIAESVESSAFRITGEEVDGDRRIEALTRGEREITKTLNGGSLGKVARVEFPKGHTFTLEIENMTRDEAEDAAERIKPLIEAKYNKYNRRHGDITATIIHEGQVKYNTDPDQGGGVE